ncbi:MAG TPA: hypothetical protein VMV18_07805 [bacterium]|nr:hypothetical protein [bacterium]
MTSTLLALALLLAPASHAKSGGAKKTSAPAAAAAPSVSVDVAGANAAAKALGLSSALAGRVDKFARNAETMQKGGIDSNVCAVMDEAVSLGQDLHSALAEEKPDPAKIAALEKAAPGLRIGVSADGGTGGANYEALGRLAAAKHGSSATILQGAGGMLDQKRPAFIVMMKNEERGCTDYSRAQAAIEKIAAGWKTAPACVKEHLKQPLATALADDELSTCWCKDADTAAFETKHYASKLSTLKDFDGPGHAKAILAEVDEAGAHFTCNAE